MIIMIFWLTIGAAATMYYFTEVPFMLPWEKRDGRRNILIALFNALAVLDSFLIAKFMTNEKIFSFSFYSPSFEIMLNSYLIMSVVGYLLSIKYLNYCFKKGRKTMT